MLISEIFGKSVDDLSPEALAVRSAKLCPFRGTTCTKSSIPDPLGVCTLSDGQHAAAVCPVRFLESDRIFKDAAGIAFGPNSDVAVFAETRILRIEMQEGPTKKIGKVDFLIAKVVDHKIRFCRNGSAGRIFFRRFY